ncbi:hypothetical protein DSM14862_04157 (plasmid) [Sulfitobacter indolifex]|nr:hypothetical protein DSM14862_04157 [Sulfitobacter indolifex]
MPLTLQRTSLFFPASSGLLEAQIAKGNLSAKLVQFRLYANSLTRVQEHGSVPRIVKFFVLKTTRQPLGLASGGDPVSDEQDSRGTRRRPTDNRSEATACFAGSTNPNCRDPDCCRRAVCPLSGRRDRIRTRSIPAAWTLRQHAPLRPLHRHHDLGKVLAQKVPRWVEEHTMICQLQLGPHRRCGTFFRRTLPANDDYRCAKSDNGHHRPQPHLKSCHIPKIPRSSDSARRNGLILLFRFGSTAVTGRRLSPGP